MSIFKPSSNELHFSAIAALAVLVLSVSANGAGVSVNNAWFRKLPENLPAAGYFDLHNGGGKIMSLIGASSPACGMLMLHRSVNMGGMERMDDVTAIDVAPGGTVKFAPGGYHLMCMEPKASFETGAQIPVTLEFADGSKLQVKVAVRDANGK
jgi:copper(I)-binding protein